MSLYVCTAKQPSSVLSFTEGQFRKSDESMIFTTSHCEILLWSVSDDAQSDSPYVLEGKFHVFCEIIASFCIRGIEGHNDSILVISVSGSWSLLSWIGVGIESRGHGILNPPDHERYKNPEGICCCQSVHDPSISDERTIILLSIWVGCYHMLIVNRRTLSVETLAVRLDPSSAFHGAEDHLLLDCVFLQPPHHQDFEGWPLAALLLADPRGIVNLEIVSVCSKPSAGTGAGAELLQGPWTVRNVNPCASLLLACPAAVGGGVLCVDPGSVVALGPTGRRGRARTGAVELVCAVALDTAGPVHAGSQEAHWLFGCRQWLLHLLTVGGGGISG